MDNTSVELRGEGNKKYFYNASDILYCSKDNENYPLEITEKVLNDWTDDLHKPLYYAGRSIQILKNNEYLYLDPNEEIRIGNCSTFEKMFTEPGDILVIPPQDSFLCEETMSYESDNTSGSKQTTTQVSLLDDVTSTIKRNLNLEDFELESNIQEQNKVKQETGDWMVAPGLTGVTTIPNAWNYDDPMGGTGFHTNPPRLAVTANPIDMTGKTYYHMAARPTFKNIGEQFNHLILMIEQLDPQNLIDGYSQWKQRIISHLTGRKFENGEEMFRVLEGYLGPSATATWNSFKSSPQTIAEYQRCVALGNNLYNFCELLELALFYTPTAKQSGTYLQEQALLRFERLQLSTMDGVKPYLQASATFLAQAGLAYSEEAILRMLRRIPGPLGQEIVTGWKKFQEAQTSTIPRSVHACVTWVVTELESRCTLITTTKQLRKGDYSFCKTIYGPTTYGEEKEKKKKPKKLTFYRNPEKETYRPKQNRPPPQRIYPSQRYPSRNSPAQRQHKAVQYKENQGFYLRKSLKKPPFLEPNRHVLRFKPHMLSGDMQLTCYVCKKEGHLSNQCPQLPNLHNAHAKLVRATNEAILDIPQNAKFDDDTESILSIVPYEEWIPQSDSTTEDESSEDGELLFQPGNYDE